MVITDDKASDKLLTASRVTAIELDNIPTPALNAASKILVSIPIMLVLIITLSRLSIADGDLNPSFSIFIPSNSFLFFYPGDHFLFGSDNTFLLFLRYIPASIAPEILCQTENTAPGTVAIVRSGKEL